MNVSEARLLSIMKLLRQGKANALDQKLVYNMLVNLSRKVKALNKQLDETIQDPYVPKMRKVK